MSRFRINNAPLFVTVLSACLGLMVAGASYPAHRTAASVLSEIGQLTGAQYSYNRASNQSMKRKVPASASFLLPRAAESENQKQEVLYRNANPLRAGNSILIVTRMPRASLDVPLS